MAKKATLAKKLASTRRTLAAGPPPHLRPQNFDGMIELSYQGMGTDTDIPPAVWTPPAGVLDTHSVGWNDPNPAIAYDAKRGDPGSNVYLYAWWNFSPPEPGLYEILPNPEPYIYLIAWALPVGGNSSIFQSTADTGLFVTHSDGSWTLESVFETNLVETPGGVYQRTAPIIPAPVNGNGAFVELAQGDVLQVKTSVTLDWGVLGYDGEVRFWLRDFSFIHNNDPNMIYYAVKWQ